MGKIIGIVALLVVIVAGAYLWSNQAKNTMQSGADSAIEKAEEAKEMVEGSQPIASLKDAMGLGQKTTCTYTTEAGDQKYTSTVVVEGNRFRSTTVMGDTTTYALNDGTTQYVWTSKDKQGYKMEMSCLEKMKDSFKNLPQSQQMQQDIESSFDNAPDVSCRPGGDVDLAVPSDITFTDQCAMMEQSLQMMQKMQQGTPAPSY